VFDCFNGLVISLIEEEDDDDILFLVLLGLDTFAVGLVLVVLVLLLDLDGFLEKKLNNVPCFNPLLDDGDDDFFFNDVDIVETNRLFMMALAIDD